MNKLLATLVAGTFAVVASSAIAQTPAPAPAQNPVTAPGNAGMAKEAAKDAKGSAAAYANPAAEKTQAEKAKEGAAAVAKSKEQPRAKSKYDEKAAQAISDNTPAADLNQKANVAASKAQSPTRTKMPDLSKLTKEQKQELYRQLQKENTGG